MTHILAAIDDTPAADAVLRTARGIGEMVGATCRAIHVAPTGRCASEFLADVDADELIVVSGDVGAEIERAAREPEVIMVVVGARSTIDGPAPVGHIASAVIERASKPVVVVPPRDGSPVRHVRRVLIPLEGTEESSLPLVDPIAMLTDAGAGPIALHVLDASHLPRFWDDAAHNLESYATEFIARWWQGPPIGDLELRRGSASTAIIDVARNHDVDLIALGWSQDLSPGHASVVRSVLTDATVPVLLIPTRASVAARSSAASLPPR